MSFAEDFDALGRIGADPAGGWSRPAFGADDIAAHDWLLGRARDAGLDARYDAFGNAVLRLDGRGRAILIGSHLDTVQSGGAYDGALGVLAGLEVLRRLKAEGAPGAPVEVIAFRDEEGRFGPFTGSRAMAGRHSDLALEKARAPDGTDLAGAVRGAGFTPANAPRDWSQVAGYFELHIEQGRVLETAGLPLGLVTAIAGQVRLALRFTGRADHAGTAPMDLRRDALVAAARFVVAFRDLVRARIADLPDPALRGTVGVIKASPNQGNVVPGEVRLGLEFRSTRDETLRPMQAETEALARRIAAEEGLETKLREVHAEPPVAMDAGLRGRLAQAARALGHDAMELPSGANHDAGVIGTCVPAALLFVPSRDGRSHCPEEHSDAAHIAAAIDVLHSAVADLRREPAR